MSNFSFNIQYYQTDQQLFEKNKNKNPALIKQEFNEAFMLQ